MELHNTGFLMNLFESLNKSKMMMNMIVLKHAHKFFGTPYISFLLLYNDLSTS